MKLWQQVFAVLAPSLLVVAGYPFYKEPLVQAVRSYRTGPTAPAVTSSAESRRSLNAADSGLIPRTAPVFVPAPSRQPLCVESRRLDLTDCRVCRQPPDDLSPVARAQAERICPMTCPDGRPIMGSAQTGFQMEIRYRVFVPCTPPIPQAEEETDAAPSEAPIEEESRTSGGSV